MSFLRCLAPQRVSAFLLAACLSILAGCGGGTPTGRGQPAAPGVRNDTPTPATRREAAPRDKGVPIRIGVVASTTGRFAAVGQEQISGARMAVDEWNARGGIDGRSIELLVEDDGGNPTGALNAYNKLMSQNPKPVAVLAPVFSPLALAMEPALNKAPVPFLTGGTAPALTDHGNEWIFRIRTNDLLGAQLAVRYLVEEMKKRKPALLYPSNDYGKGGKQSIEDALAKYNLKLVAAESFNAGDKDMTAQLLKIKQAEPDLLIVWTVPDDSARVSIVIQQLGLGIPVLGSSGFGTEDYYGLAKGASEGITVVLDTILGYKEKSAAWAEKFKAKFGKVPATFVASVYYDGANLLLSAIQRSGTDAKALQQGLRSIKDFEGITSSYSFDAKGDGVRKLMIARWEGGKLVPLATLAQE